MSKKIGLFKRCPGYKNNFASLKSAFENGDVGMLECVDKLTKKEVAVICAITKDADGMVTMVPFAKMFDGNPYDELEPPIP